jgi:hypothetical protein
MYWLNIHNEGNGDVFTIRRSPLPSTNSSFAGQVLPIDFKALGVTPTAIAVDPVNLFVIYCTLTI